MKISVSDLKLHVTCPTKFHYVYNLKRGVDREEPAQEIGSFAHEILDLKLNRALWRPRLDEIETTAKDWPALKLMLQVWEPHPDWKIHAVEKEYSLGLPSGDTLVGRPDAVVEYLGGFWHLQHKTIASSKPPATFTEIQRTDWHECVYQRMLEEAGYRPFKGTILNMLRKLSVKTLLDNPHAGIVTTYAPRSENEVNQALFDITMRLGRIHTENKIEVREKTRQSCGGHFGNSLCPYKGVCDGWLEINSNAFVDIKDRYAENEPE